MLYVKNELVTPINGFSIFLRLPHALQIIFIMNVVVIFQSSAFASSDSDEAFSLCLSSITQTYQSFRKTMPFTSNEKSFATVDTSPGSRHEMIVYSSAGSVKIADKHCQMSVSEPGSSRTAVDQGFGMILDPLSTMTMGLCPKPSLKLTEEQSTALKSVEQNCGNYGANTTLRLDSILSCYGLSSANTSVKPSRVSR